MDQADRGLPSGRQPSAFCRSFWKSRVAEGPLIEPDRELAPVGSPAPWEVVDLGSSEGSVNGLSRCSCHHRGER